jgi:hypothetical protein
MPPILNDYKRLSRRYNEFKKLDGSIYSGKELVAS